MNNTFIIISIRGSALHREMTTVETQRAWREIASNRMALHSLPNLATAVSSPLGSDTRRLEEIVGLTNYGVLLVELLTNELEYAGNPDRGTYSVLCFEPAANGQSFRAPTLHAVSGKTLDKLRAFSPADATAGNVSLPSPTFTQWSLLDALTQTVCVDNGDHYACLYALEIPPATFFFPVKVSKGERLAASNRFFPRNAQRPGGRVAVDDLFAALQTAPSLDRVVVRAGARVPTPAVLVDATFRVSKQRDVESGGRVSRRLLERLRWMYETDDHQFAVGVHTGTKTKVRTYDALSFYTLEEVVEQSGLFSPVGHAWVRTALLADTESLPGGRVRVGNDTLSPRKFDAPARK